MTDPLIGATTAAFAISLSVALTEPVDVAWTTKDGTAKAGKDYLAANGVVTFLPGETEKQIQVTVYGASATDPSKNFYIQLTPPTNAILGNSLVDCTITVVDEDGTAITTVVVAQGKQGLKGDPGISAYEQAVLMGYEGTVQDWMDAIADASHAAERAQEAIAEVEANAAIAAAAAAAAAFSGRIYPTPSAGVDPVTGVPNGNYFNVRSTTDENFIDEYRNVGGVATPTGKSYPNADSVRYQVDGTLSLVSNPTFPPIPQIKKLTGAISTELNAQGIALKERTEYLNQKLISVKDFGAIGDGTLHTINEWVVAGKFSNLTGIQVVYPHATALTDSIDWVACQAAINYAGAGGSVIFDKTTQNTYIINKPLKYFNAQCWIGCGGVDVVGLGTELKLSESATSVVEPNNPASVTCGFNPVGMYFNALSYAPAGLWLYNTSYSNIDQCAANCAAVNGGAFLFDSDTSKQCYFNKLNIPRAFAAGDGGTAFKFIRGANANQIWGGKAGGSYRGASFSTLSAGNLIVGTDFEENTDCHIYVDAPSNVFFGLHMENAPIGFNITANGSDTRRYSTTFASTVTIPVQKANDSRETLVHDTFPSGLSQLITGSSRQSTQYFSSSVTQNNDFSLLAGTENIVVNFFRNTNSSSATKNITFFKGDGTSTEAFRLNLATAEIQCGDIVQKSATNLQRKVIRAAAIPTTGAWSTGDKVLRTNTNTTNSVVSEWTCVAAGTPGTWAATSWYVGKGATASRPTGLTATDVGVQYFDTTLAAAGKPIWWNGAAWVDATGTIV